MYFQFQINISGGTPGSARRGLSRSSRKLSVGVEDEEASTMEGGSASMSIKGNHKLKLSGGNIS